jgi:hypothetical protein
LSSLALLLFLVKAVDFPLERAQGIQIQSGPFVSLK